MKGIGRGAIWLIGLLVLVGPAVGQAWGIRRIFSRASVAATSVSNAVSDFFDETLGLGECAFAYNASGDVKVLLQERIAAQEEAVEELTRLIDIWSSRTNSEESRRSKPLVLVLTGGTGTGKTLSASLIAEKALAYRTNPDSRGRTAPKGFLTLQGAAFADGSTGTTRLRDTVLAHATKCRRGGVILMDEAQKAAGKVIDELLSLAHNNLEETIVLLTSDLTGEMIKTLAAQAAERGGNARQEMKKLLRRELEAKWREQNIEITNRVTSIVPFLPLTKSRALEVVRACASASKSDNRYSRILVDVLAATALRGTQYVKYNKTSRVTEAGVQASEEWVEHGARALCDQDAGPILRLEALLHSKLPSSFVGPEGRTFYGVAKEETIRHVNVTVDCSAREPKNWCPNLQVHLNALVTPWTNPSKEIRVIKKLLWTGKVLPHIA